MEAGRAEPMSSAAPIAALPEPTAAAMRAHLAFPTLPSLTTALVHNALDARANHIRISLDLGAWSLECEDDGHGFPLDFFPGSSSATAVARSQPMPQRRMRYGRNGAALQSMAHLGRLTITSAPDSAPGKTFMMIQRGHTCSYAGPDPTHNVRRLQKGTRVSISDLFSALPVRRRALNTAYLRRAEIERVKRAITIVSLREPQVTFILRVSGVDTAQEDSASAASWKELARVPKTTSLHARFLDTFSKYPLDSQQLIEVHGSSADAERVTLRGLISLAPVYSKDLQHIFVDRHWLSPGSNLADISASQGGSRAESQGKGSGSSQVSPSKHAARSRFRDADVDLYAAAIAAFQTSMAFKPIQERKSTQAAVTRSPNKGKGQHPAFLLDITVVPAQHATADQASKGHRLSVTEVIQSAVGEGLRRHGLLRTLTLQSSLHGREAVPAAPITSAWPEHSPLIESELPKSMIRRSPVKRKRTMTEQSMIALPYGPDPGAKPVADSEFMDDITGQKFVIDFRTGNSRALASSGLRDQGQDSVPNAMQSDTPKSKAILRGRPSAAEVPLWLQDSMSSWRNPVLPLPEEAGIPALKSGGASTTAESHPTLSAMRRREAGFALPSLQANSRFFPRNIGARTQQWHHGSHLDTDDEMKLEEIEGAVSKGALSEATVIGQVDRKFVLCILPAGADVPEPRDQMDDTHKVLVLIDQHAADERVRVERFLEDLMRSCRADTPERYSLPVALEVDMKAGEVNALRNDTVAKHILDRLGFTLTFANEITEDPEETAASATQAGMLVVSSIPSVIKERLLVEPALVAALLRSFLASTTGPVLLNQLGENAHSYRLLDDGQSKDSTATSLEWVGLLRTLPKLMLDLIYSRACRGAIMFNDILTSEQCERLVADLSRTAFPFQCAHGRPSMLPLVVLPPDARLLSGCGQIDWSSLLT